MCVCVYIYIYTSRKTIFYDNFVSFWTMLQNTMFPTSGTTIFLYKKITKKLHLEGVALEVASLVWQGCLVLSSQLHATCYSASGYQRLVR